MSEPMTDNELLAALRKWRVRLVEYPGWRDRQRPDSLGWGPIHGVLAHHTGSDSQSQDYLHFLFEEGRPTEGIPAPLYNIAIKKDGTAVLGAARRANDSGKGSSRTLAHLIRQDYPGYRETLDPGGDDTDGNRFFYDYSFMTSGPVSEAQYDTGVLVSCAILDHYGWSALSVAGHKEWSGRKPDPILDMPEYRRDIRDSLNAGPFPRKTRGRHVDKAIFELDIALRLTNDQRRERRIKHALRILRRLREWEQ